MKNNLQVIDQRKIFNEDFKIYGTFENPLFLAKDVAEWIDYAKNGEGYYDVSNMLATIDVEEKGKFVSTNNLRSSWFLTEDGLYEVLFQSRKPIAKLFKKEVKKILKELRTNGNNTLSVFNENATQITSALSMIVPAIQEMQNQANKIGSTISTQAMLHDEDRKELKDMIGIRAINKTHIVALLKETLSSLYGRLIKGSDKEFKRVKTKIMLRFEVSKWEDVPVTKYQELKDYIKELELQDVV